MDAIDSLAGRLSASSPVLALILKFRLGLLADPQNFYPAEGAEFPFLDEQAAASWLEASRLTITPIHLSSQCRSYGPWI